MGFGPQKRFWTDVTLVETPAGFGVALDGRAIRTPSRAELTLPKRRIAEDVAAEWQAQTEVIDPLSMPMTRAANSALDKVALNQAAVATMLVEYGGTDLLCYRVADPALLAARQSDLWDPWLAWAEAEFQASLTVAAGVMHIAQPTEALDRLRAEVADLDVWRLTALHDLVVLSGSLVLALAVRHQALPAPEAWALSRVEEIWQQEQWGVDAEAEVALAEKSRAFATAAHLMHLLEDHAS